MITLNKVADLIKEKDNFEIITHVYPDGDTLGSGFGLCLALQHMGKNAKVIIAGDLPSKFEYLTKGVKKQNFKAQCVISVDIATASLLGENQKEYEDKINICLDHHQSNDIKADYSYVDSTAAAACEIIYDLICLLNMPITLEIANCIYTGVSTDTGCFRYSNTTPKTHRIAAKLMEANADWHKINEEMFETKTRKMVEFESKLYDTMEFFAKGKGAIIYTTLAMQKEVNINNDEIEGISSIPKRIEGVFMGITMRQQEENLFKVSVRTSNSVNASSYCSAFGGGGHAAAAGCTIEGSLEEVKDKLIKEAEKIL